MFDPKHSLLHCLHFYAISFDVIRFDIRQSTFMRSISGISTSGSRIVIKIYRYRHRHTHSCTTLPVQPLPFMVYNHKMTHGNFFRTVFRMIFNHTQNLNVRQNYVALFFFCFFFSWSIHPFRNCLVLMVDIGHWIFGTHSILALYGSLYLMKMLLIMDW